MAGLGEVGIAGSENLREALTNCTDPLAAIEEFQMQNGILLPSLRPALPFLDLHCVNRLEFHDSVMEELRDRLISRIHTVSESEDKNRNKILNDLLVKSFPVIKHKSLRPVVLCLMQQVPKIKQEYLKVIINDKELYQEASVEVKQQIWQDHQKLFGSEVSPILMKYIEEKESKLYSHDDIHQNFFSPSPKTRRQDEIVQKLTKMVGKNVKLYDMVLQFLRTFFLRTRNVHYCSLRAEILMSLHDTEVHEICSVDPCHKFTWCLDACIREKFVDSKRARELQGFLDGVKRGQEQVLGDLAMILCDPYAINTIALSAMKAMQHCMNTEIVPRNNEELILLLRMLSLGLNAWEMIDSQNFKEPKLEIHLVTRLLPCIISLMVDDQVQTLISKIPEEAPMPTDPLPDFLLPFCKSNAIACTALLFYLLQATKQRDSAAIIRILPIVSQCDVDVVYQDTFLHQFVSHLAGLAEFFSNTAFFQVVFEQFLMPFSSRENVLRMIFRLLWWVHMKMPPATVRELMNKLLPNKQNSPGVHSTYQALNERINSYQPVPVCEPEKLDSPLMAVPAPTPAPHRS